MLAPPGNSSPMDIMNDAQLDCMEDKLIWASRFNLDIRVSYSPCHFMNHDCMSIDSVQSLRFSVDHW